MSGTIYNTDATHKSVRDGLRAAGLVVVDTASVGGGFPDLLVVNPESGRVGFMALEVKSFDNIRAGKIEKEIKFMLRLVPEFYRMIEDPEVAVRVMRDMLK
jgi:hypothetical protein